MVTIGFEQSARRVRYVHGVHLVVAVPTGIGLSSGPAEIREGRIHFHVVCLTEHKAQLRPPIKAAWIASWLSFIVVSTFFLFFFVV